MAKRTRARRARWASASALAAAAVGAGVNVATGRPSILVVIVALGLVLVSAGVEWWRMARVDQSPESEGPSAEVRQRVGSIVDGDVIGVRGPVPAKDLQVHQEVDTVGENGRLIGYDGNSPA